MPDHPFGLSENPFADGHDPAFLYPAAKRAEAVALLRKRIADRESFITITGDAGSGKTSLVTELLEDATLKAKVAYVAHPSLTPSELLEAVCIEFGAPLPTVSSKPQTLASLEHYLRALRQQGFSAVLVLDEAHGLKTELLEEARLLSNMKADGRPLLQTILVGLPELERRLGLAELAQLRQRIAVHCRVAPLTAQETEGYLRHRIGAAGGDGATIFPAEACREIHNYTNGFPRDINTLAGRALECAEEEGAKAVTVEHVRIAAGDARPHGIATAPRVTSGAQPFELKRNATPARPTSAPPRAPERKAEPPPPPPKPEARRPPSFLSTQLAARAGDGLPTGPATAKAVPPIEHRFRRGEVSPAELAAERSERPDPTDDPADFLGSEGVRELGASVVLVGLLVTVLIGTGRWNPVASPPEPPAAERSSPTWRGDAHVGSPEGARTRAVEAMAEAMPETPAAPPAEEYGPVPAPSTGVDETTIASPPVRPSPAAQGLPPAPQVIQGPSPAPSTPDLTLGTGGGRMTGIGFEVASTLYPDSAATVLRKIMRGSKLPCRIVAKTSGDPYRVVVGPFKSRREAEKAITELFRSALVERARIVQVVE